MSGRARPATSIRILIADDHPVVRDGLRGMLEAEPDLEVVAEAADGREALTLVGRHRPDVVLIDLRMPVLDGVAAIRRLSTEHPDVRVIVLTTYDEDHDIVRAMEAGATGYLLEDTPRADLHRAVRAAATVKTHLVHAFNKLGVDDRTAAVTVALERGLLHLGDR